MCASMMRMVAAAAITAFALVPINQQAKAQEQPARTESKGPAKDYPQRSLELVEFRKAAPSGTERGREIFYYKCWFCHNDFTSRAPQLKGLYARPTLISGD